MENNNTTSPSEERQGDFSKILEDLPEDKKEIIEQTIVERSFSMMGQFSPESALSKKVTAEHITSFLDVSKENMQKEYQERRETKVFILLILLLALGAFFVAVVLLKDNPELLVNVLSAVGGLVAGAFGGYGYGKSKAD